MYTQNDFIKEQSRCIAHEIRNQISIIDVYAEIIKKHLQKSGYENESVDNALNCIQKSAKMVNNSLLDLKSLNNYEHKSLDLQTIILQSVDLSRVYIHDKDIIIKTEIEGSCQILADENKFLACMINILKNAIEAIDFKGEIFVNAEVLDKNAVIKIKNNGQKIPSDKIETIFQEGITTKASGSGLGLYICKNNLEKQNAKLKLNYSNDDFTEFEILLPVNNS